MNQQWFAMAAALDGTGAVAGQPSRIAVSDSTYPVEIALAPHFVAYARGNAADEGIPRVFTRQMLGGPLRARAVRHSLGILAAPGRFP